MGVLPNDVRSPRSKLGCSGGKGTRRGMQVKYVRCLSLLPVAKVGRASVFVGTKTGGGYT